MIDISIVTFNSSKDLPNLLKSLETYTSEQISIYFYDNNSQDNTVKILKDFLKINPNSYLFESDINLGFGKAHNNNLKIGNGEYLFILNPDTELFFDTISILSREADKDILKQVAAWEPRQLPYEHPKHYNPVTGEVDWFSGAAVLIRRSAFEFVEGFDDAFFLYGEDVDLSWRLRSAGFKLLYVPQSSLIHNCYSKANEIKPVQHMGMTYANLCLRARYGGWKDILIGWYLYFKVILKGTKHIKNQRWGLVKNFFIYLKNWFHFRTNTFSRKSFYKWDYCLKRRGAFFLVHYYKKFSALPKVSVLIRTVGRENLLKMALDCLCRQTYPNIEVVIVQDGPKTLDLIIDEYKNLLSINYQFTDFHVGRSTTGNKALEVATGKYCIFLDEDDLFYSDHIEQLVGESLLGNYRGVYSLSYEVPTLLEKNNKIVTEGQFNCVYDQDFSLLTLLYKNFIPINCLLFERDLYEECGGFDPDLDCLEDWNLWVRFAIRAGYFHKINKTTAIYRIPFKKEEKEKRNQTFKDNYESVRSKHSKYLATIRVGDLYEENQCPIPVRLFISRFASELLFEYPFLKKFSRPITRLLLFFIKVQKKIFRKKKVDSHAE